MICPDRRMITPEESDSESLVRKMSEEWESLSDQIEELEEKKERIEIWLEEMGVYMKPSI